MQLARDAPRFEVDKSCEAADPGGPVALRVLAFDEKHSPLPGATVRIADLGGTAPAARLETDEQGSAEVEVGPGLWQIEASLPGYASGKYLLELRAGQACVIRFTLRHAEGADDVFVF